MGRVLLHGSNNNKYIYIVIIFIYYIILSLNGIITYIMPLLKTKRRSPAREKAHHCAKTRMGKEQTFVGISKSVFKHPTKL